MHSKNCFALAYFILFLAHLYVLFSDYVLFVFFSLLKSVLNNNKQITKVKVCNFIQEYLALKRTALFKRRGALILSGYFRNNADAVWGKNWRLAFFKTFYTCIGSRTSFPHISHSM